MVNVMDDSNQLPDTYSPGLVTCSFVSDGGYYPRLMFVDPQTGAVDKTVTGPNSQYGYFYSTEADVRQSLLTSVGHQHEQGACVLQTTSQERPLGDHNIDRNETRLVDFDRFALQTMSLFPLRPGGILVRGGALAVLLLRFIQFRREGMRAGIDGSSEAFKCLDQVLQELREAN